MGRRGPKPWPAELVRRSVHLRARREELAAWQAAAEREGVTFSAWARRVLVEAASRASVP